MQRYLISDNPSHRPALWAYAQTLAESTEDDARQEGVRLQKHLLSIGYDPDPKPDPGMIDGCHAILPPCGRETYDNGRRIAQFIHDLPGGWSFTWGHDGRTPTWHRYEGAELMPREAREADPNCFHTLTIHLHVGWDDLGRDQPFCQWFTHQGGHHIGMGHGMADTPKEAIEAGKAWFSEHGASTQPSNRSPDETPS